MAPSTRRRYTFEPTSAALLPSVVEEEEEDGSSCDDSYCNDASVDDDTAVNTEWSLSSSLLNNTETNSSNSSSGGGGIDDSSTQKRIRTRQQQEELQGLLNLGSSTSRNNVSYSTPEEEEELSSTDEDDDIDRNDSDEKNEDPASNRSSSAVSSHSNVHPTPQNALRYNTEYQKYFKMLAAGVPMDWVVKVCEVDRKDPSVLYLNPDEPLESQLFGGSNNSSSSNRDYPNDSNETPIKDNRAPINERTIDTNDEKDAEEQEEMSSPLQSSPIVTIKGSPSSSPLAAKCPTKFFASRLGMDTSCDAKKESEDPEAIEAIAGQEPPAILRSVSSSEEEKSTEAPSILSAISTDEETEKQVVLLENDQESLAKKELPTIVTAISDEDAFHDATDETPATSPNRPSPTGIVQSSTSEDDEFHDANESCPPKIERKSNMLTMMSNDAAEQKDNDETDKAKGPAMPTNKDNDKTAKQPEDFRKAYNHVAPQNVILRDFGGQQTAEPEKQSQQNDDTVEIVFRDFNGQVSTVQEEKKTSKGFFGNWFGGGNKKKDDPTTVPEQPKQDPTITIPEVDEQPKNLDDEKDEKQSLAVAKDKKEPLHVNSTAPTITSQQEEEQSSCEVPLVVTPDSIVPEKDHVKEGETMENVIDNSDQGIENDENQDCNDSLEDKPSVSTVESCYPQSPEEEQDSVPLDKDPAYAKYFLMLRAGVPIDRIRLIVELDKKDPCVLDMDPTLSYRSQLDGDSDNEEKKEDGTSNNTKFEDRPPSLSAGYDRESPSNHAENYGQQQHAVVTPQHDKGVKSTAEIDDKRNKPQRQSSELDLPLCKDPAYARYFLMLKARVPIDRVRNVVELDGKDPGILDLDPNRSYASQVSGNGDGGDKAEIDDDNDNNNEFTDDDENDNSANPTRDRLDSGDDHDYDQDDGRGYGRGSSAYRTVESNYGGQHNMMPAAYDRSGAPSHRAATPKQRVGPAHPPSAVSQDIKSFPHLAAYEASLQKEFRPGKHHTSPPADASERGSFHHRAEYEAALQPFAVSLLSDAGKANLDAMFARRVAELAQVKSAVQEKRSSPHFGQGVSNAGSQPVLTDGNVSMLKDDPEYERYFKMLKVGLPLGAVKQAMAKDGKDSSILDSYPNQTIAGQSAGSIESQESGDSCPALKDDPEYAKYFKMLKMKIPLGAVKQSMVKDGKDNSILDLDPNKPLAMQKKDTSESSNDLPLKDDPEYAKYFKMLKMKIPLGAVKQSMVKDGKDSTILDLDPNKPLSAQHAKNDEENRKQKDAPALKDDPEYSKYFKMLKMKIPLGAVKQSMVKDGKDVAVLDLDPNKPLSAQRTKNDEENSNQKDDVNAPALKDDPEYSKYFKMLKMKIPLGAVKQSMAKDGKDVAVLDLDPEKSLASQIKGEANAKQSKDEKEEQKAKKVARKRLFWNSIDKSNLQGSLWDSSTTLDLKGLEYDEDEFESLFTSKGKDKTPKKEATDVSSKQPKSKRSTVQLIDSRRQMNGCILLAKYKHDYNDLSEKLNNLDSDVMEETELLALMQLLPTKDESLAIRSYLPPADSPQSAKDDAMSKLGECEKYMASMGNVKNVKGKFECLLYRAQFNGLVADLASEISCLKEALACVRNSDKLARLMLFALRLGNTLNTGASGEEAAAITLDSLLKLHEAKAFDKKTSVLHYLVSIIEKNDKEVLNVSEELLPALKAERIIAEALAKSLADLEKGLKRLKSMVDQIKSETDKGESMSSMEQFVQEAGKELTRLKTELDASKDAFADLLKYFGENQDMHVQEFFSTLTRFIATFESARADVKRMQEAKARRERMAKKQKTKSLPAGSPEESPSNARSAVLHEIVKVQSQRKLKEAGVSEEIIES